MTVVRSESALNLAVFRITVPVIILISPETWRASAWASLAPELRVVPEGLGHAVRHLPISPAWADAAHWVLVGACAAAIVGALSRIAMTVVTLAGLYVFGMSQLSGSVTHDMHLLWFSALLAASPCGDALSVDRWIARRRGAPPAEPSSAYAVPLHAARLLLGVVYLFPGFWKLHTAGAAWIFSDNLRNQMYWKWYQMGWTPSVRIDRFPTLLHAGALAAVAFEISFFLLVLSPRLRPLAAAAGLAFHGFAQAFLLIPFSSLWGCYTVLIDWSALAREKRTHARSPQGTDRRAWPAAVIGAGLLMANVVQGARGAMQAWPFACYPTFQWTVGTRIPDLLLEAVRPDGSRIVVPDGPSGGGHRTQQRWAMVWQVAGFYGSAPNEQKLRAYWMLLRRDPRAQEATTEAVALRFYAARYSVIPEDLGSPPLERKFLGELALPHATGAR